MQLDGGVVDEDFGAPVEAQLAELDHVGNRGKKTVLYGLVCYLLILTP